jgi:transposase
MRYIGVDLHKTNFVVCFLPMRGQSRVVTFPLSEEGLTTFRRQLRAEDEVAVEVGQNTYYFQEQIQERVKRVVLVDPHRFAVISRSKKKTDRHDASLLARFLKLGWVPTVPNPSPQIRELRTLFQARDNLVGMTTKLKNMGHGVFTRHGQLIDVNAFASGRGRQRPATTAGLPAGDQQILGIVLQQLENLKQAIATIETQIVQAGKTLPGLRRVLQIPGINLLSGMGLLTEIGSIQ